MVVKEPILWQPFAPLYVVTCYHEVTEGYLVASKAGFLSQPFPPASLSFYLLAQCKPNTQRQL